MLSRLWKGGGNRLSSATIGEGTPHGVPVVVVEKSDAMVLMLSNPKGKPSMPVLAENP